MGDYGSGGQDANDEAMRPTKEQSDHKLRGFAYFDSFDELERWKEEDVDPLQRSNTPLLKRPVTPASPRKTESSNVMLMHDYKSGYLDNGYEGCQGAIISNEDYVLEYWQRVEAFNYFTHHRVTIPPPTWVNAGHRNGALVLGTFIVESADPNEHPAKDAELILKKKPDDTYVLADVLARMAACYVFDGWLINLESKIDVDDDVWNGGKSLEACLTQLKENMASLPSGGKVFWYDAVTKDNVGGKWQNTLNANNVGFARSAGSFVTNYWWEEGYPAKAAKIADDSIPKMSRDDVYFGTDCWAQIKLAHQENTRKTYGESPIGDGKPGVGVGHGGTATGLGVKPLPSHGMGTGIFAPGWAYEHFTGGKGVDRFMWEGKPALETVGGLYCKCQIGIQQHIRSDLENNSISEFTKRFPAGSDAFFHTDYMEPITHLGAGKFRAHLGQQSVLPAPGERSAALLTERKENVHGTMTAELIHSPSRCFVAVSTIDIPASIVGMAQIHGELVLHTLNARADLGLEVQIGYERQVEISGLQVHLFVKVGGTKIMADLSAAPRKHDGQILTIPKTHNRLNAIGISVQCPARDFVRTFASKASGLLDIFDITVRPIGFRYPKSYVDNVKFEQHGTTDATNHHRLVWSIPIYAPPAYLPYSPLTGPFSHFVVKADGKDLGRAYALAFVIHEDQYKDWKEQDQRSVIYVEIKGFAFDGSDIGSFAGNVRLM